MKRRDDVYITEYMLQASLHKPKLRKRSESFRLFLWFCAAFLVLASVAYLVQLSLGR